MSDEVTRLTEKISKLRLRRSQAIAELQEIDQKYDQLEESLEAAKKQSSNELVGKDAKGNSLRIGDSVTTLTRGRYHERIAEVIHVSSGNHIDIKYKTSGKSTWRIGHNILRSK